MYSRKILASVLSLAMTGVMVVPAFATTTITAPVVSTGDVTAYTNAFVTQATTNQSLNTNVTVDSPTYQVALPTSLVFSIDPFETAENGQINSPDFLAINYSNVPVKIDITSKLAPFDATADTDLKVKSLSSEVNGVSADNYDATNTDKEIFAQFAVVNTDAISVYAEDASNIDATTDEDGYYKPVTATNALGFTQVKGIKTTGDYLKDPDATSEENIALAYPDDARITLKDTDSKIGIYLAKGKDAVPEDGSQYNGLMRSLHAQSISSFRFVGNVNPNADWKTKKAGNTTNAAVDFTTTYSLTGVSPALRDIMVDRLIGDTTAYIDSVKPAITSTAANLTLTSTKAGSPAEFTITPGTAGSDGSTAATGVTSITIKDMPSSAEATDTSVMDRVLTEDQYTYDAATGKLSIALQDVAWYTSRIDKLTKTTSNKYKAIIVMNDSAKTEFEVEITFKK